MDFRVIYIISAEFPSEFILESGKAVSDYTDTQKGIFMVTISEVEKKSIAQKAGLKAGDILIAINGHEIRDVLDYRYYLTEPNITLTIHRGPELFDTVICKEEYEDIGLIFDSFLMDEKHACRNQCIFCFIDQLPKGMRDTLYFKDDDSRLSFLHGNYITLTNLKEQDIDRICEMKMSPVNISVHTTNPVLRCQMMKNKNAGTIMQTLQKFADAKILINAQIVLCKGVNDADELERTMRDLASLYPMLESCSIVPSGLTKYRQGLYPLEPFEAKDCAAVIDQVERFAEQCCQKYGKRLFFCGDEMYVKAGVRLPEESAYEGYPQIENGVGLMRSMLTEFEDELNFIDEYDTDTKRKCSIATGAAAYDFICSLVEKLKEVCYNLDCTVYRIENKFFGENITVAGLITGQDLINQLRGQDLGEVLLLPKVMVRAEDHIFLDDVTVEQVEQALGTKVKLTENDGAALIQAILS